MEILRKVTELKAELDSCRPLESDQEAAIMQKFRLDWNFHSNHLEGNSLSYGETKALILFGITAAGKPLKDHFEITGHDKAIKWVEEVVKEDRPLTENFIRQIHKLILKEPYEVWGKTIEGKPQSKQVKIGEYKSTPNHVETITGEIFRFATPEETPAKMTDLIDWYRDKKEDPETHPLLLAAEFHYKFIRIHPFDDGNGRTARILMNFILMQYGYPPVIVKTEDKQNYFGALRQADAGSISPFIEYIGNNLEQSLALMIRGAKGESIDEADDVDKEIELIEQKLKSIGKSETYVAKSNSILETAYSESISKLISFFCMQSSKFENLYYSYEFVVGDGVSSKPFYIPLKFDFIGEHELLLIEQRFFSGGGVKEFYVSIEYEKFNKIGCGEFSYDSGFYIFFDTHQYSISSKKDDLSVIKLYNEKLSQNEIASIVRAETKAHTDFINQQIEKAKFH